MDFYRYLAGRRIVGVVAIVLVLLEAQLFIALWLGGNGRPVEGLLRVAITAALGWWMYRGSNIARWLIVVLFGIGGAATLINMLALERVVWVLVIKSAFQLRFTWQLAREQNVRVFFGDATKAPDDGGALAAEARVDPFDGYDESLREATDFEAKDNDIPVVVSTTSFASNDPYAVVESNISFLNAQLVRHAAPEELSSRALCSYYVDYYLFEVNNGGFGQFVYNSRWRRGVVHCVRTGLVAIGATAHLELFDRCAAKVGRLGESGLHSYLKRSYWGDNSDRDALDEHNSAFFELDEREDLVQLNNDWLRSLPDLVVLSAEEMAAEVDRRIAAISDLEAREMRARANAPRCEKLIRKLCQSAGHEFSHITAGDPTHVFEGRPRVAWHFFTDRGHYYMVDAGDRAIMYENASKSAVAEVDATGVA